MRVPRDPDRACMCASSAAAGDVANVLASALQIDDRERSGLRAGGGYWQVSAVFDDLETAGVAGPARLHGDDRGIYLLVDTPRVLTEWVRLQPDSSPVRPSLTHKLIRSANTWARASSIEARRLNSALPSALPSSARASASGNCANSRGTQGCHCVTARLCSREYIRPSGRRRALCTLPRGKSSATRSVERPASSSCS